MALLACSPFLGPNKKLLSAQLEGNPVRSRIHYTQRKLRRTHHEIDNNARETEIRLLVITRRNSFLAGLRRS